MANFCIMCQAPTADGRKLCEEHLRQAAVFSSSFGAESEENESASEEPVAPKEAKSEGKSRKARKPAKSRKSSKKSKKSQEPKGAKEAQPAEQSERDGTTDAHEDVADAKEVETSQAPADEPRREAAEPDAKNAEALRTPEPVRASREETQAGDTSLAEQGEQSDTSEDWDRARIETVVTRGLEDMRLWWDEDDSSIRWPKLVIYALHGGLRSRHFYGMTPLDRKGGQAPERKYAFGDERVQKATEPGGVLYERMVALVEEHSDALRSREVQALSLSFLERQGTVRCASESSAGDSVDLCLYEVGEDIRPVESAK